MDTDARTRTEKPAFHVPFRPWEKVDSGDCVNSNNSVQLSASEEDEPDPEPENKKYDGKMRHRADLWHVKKYLMGQGYPAHIQHKNDKANFRRQCKPYAVHKVRGKQRLFYIRLHKNADASNKQRDFTSNTMREVIMKTSKRAQLIIEVRQGSGPSVEATALAGHRGRDSCYETLSKLYYWPDMYNEVSEFCQTCLVCQKCNPAVLKVRDALQPVAIPKRPMAQIGIDLCQLPEVDGKKYVVVAVDYFTKWVEARALPDKSAAEVAKFLYEDVICHHGCVETIISDQGTEFNNGVINELFRMTNIRHRVTRPYHPQANGMVERVNRTLKNALLKACDGDKEKWLAALQGVVFAYGVVCQRSTKFSPYFLLYQREPILPVQQKEVSEEADDLPEVLDENEEEIDEVKFWEVLKTSINISSSIYDAVMENIKNAQEQQKLQYDKRHMTGADFYVGQKVLLVNSRREGRKGGKIDECPRSGPYEIVELNATKGARLKNEKGVVLKTVFPIKRLYTFHERKEIHDDNNATSDNPDDPPPRKVDKQTADIVSVLSSSDDDDQPGDKDQDQVNDKRKPGEVQQDYDDYVEDKPNAELRISQIPLVPNGNNCPPISAAGTLCKLQNTCPFDSLLQILSAANLISPKYADVVTKNKNLQFFSIVDKLSSGDLAGVLTDRYDHLRLHFNATSLKLRRKNAAPVVINCQTTAIKIVEICLGSSPSVIQTKSCNGKSCPCSVIHHNRVIIKLSTPEGGVSKLQAEVDKYFRVASKTNCYRKVKKSHCLSDPDVTVHDKVLRCAGLILTELEDQRSHLIIECCDTNANKTVECRLRLKDIPLQLSAPLATYSLRGVIEFQGELKAQKGALGHYRACVHVFGTWFVYDDLRDEPMLCDTEEEIRSHILVYTV